MASYPEVILNDLQAARRNFNRLVRIGLLITLVCHLYVIEPYFLYRAEERAASEGLREGQARIRELSGQLAPLEKAVRDVHTALEDIKERIRAFPDHLQAMLPVLQSRVESQGRRRYPEFSAIQQSGPPERQFLENAPLEQPAMPPGIRTFEEAVRWYTNQWFDGLTRALDEDVIGPVLEVRRGSSNGAAGKLSRLSAEAVRKVRHYIETVDPDFWRSYGRGKVPVARGLYEVVSESFDPLYREIEALSREIREDIRKRKERIEDIEKTLGRSRDLLKELESRLETLESPIGRIPVGLTDFIKLYPLLLAALVAAIAFHLRRSRDLQGILMEELSGGGSGLDGKALNYQGRCWYLPPFRNMLYPLILVTLLLLLTGLFVRSVLLVAGEPGLFTSLTSRTEPLSRRFFLGVYVLGALLITGSLLAVTRSLTVKGNFRQ